MLRIIIGSIRYKSDKFIYKSIKIKDSYRRLNWNFFERLIVSCSKNPGKAIGSLLLFFAVLFYVMQLARPLIQPMAARWLPHWETIFDWQTTLLAGQLTIIGIVYPLVVGLISLIFQKKSARKIVQAAYQTYSGFMLAGLSGLVLAGFILSGIFIRTFCSNYSYAVVSGISITWMMVNIGLSVWFFIKSLSVLDDVKRDKMVLRYLTADVLEVILKRRVAEAFRAGPFAQRLIDPVKYPHITLQDYSFEPNLTTIFTATKHRKEINDVYLTPLKLIIHFINFRNRIKREKLSFSFYHPYEGNKSGNLIPLFKVHGLSPNSRCVRLLKLCFSIARPPDETINNGWIIRGMLGEAVDALAAGDIYAFEEALHSVTRDFSAIADVFSFRNELETGNLLLMKRQGMWEQSFNEHFYSELYRLGRQAVLRTGLSGRFFSQYMQLPRILFESRSESTVEEIQLGLNHTCYAWETLQSWGKSTLSNPDPGLRQAYDTLVREFVALWEGWSESLHYKLELHGNVDVFNAARISHLRLLPDILMHAVVAGDAETVRLAADMFNRWLNKPHEGELDYSGLLPWQEFFITPAIFCGYKPFNAENISTMQVVNYDGLPVHAWKNALTDVRLTTAAFLLKHARELNADRLRFSVDTLLNGGLVDNTGGYERVSMAFSNASDVTDALIRTLAWGRKGENPAAGWLTGLIRYLSSAHGKDMISGRVYSGNRLSGFSDLNRQFAELMIMASSASESPSLRIKSGLSAGIFSYGVKERLVERIRNIKHELVSLPSLTLENGKDFTTCQSAVNNLLGEYIRLFSESMEQDILALPVSTVKVDALSQKVSDMVKDRLSNIFPFNQFLALNYHPELEQGVKHPILFRDERIYYSEGISKTVFGTDSSLCSRIVNVLSADLLGWLQSLKASAELSSRSLPDIIDRTSKLPELEEDDCLIICDTALSEELSSYCFEHRIGKDDGQSQLFYDENGKLKIRGLHVNCTLISFSFYRKAHPIVINNRAFSELRIKEPQGKGPINFVAETDPDDSKKILLRADFEYQRFISEPPKVRFIYPG